VNSITRRLAAVAFADVAGWSRLVEANELDALHAWNALRTGLIEPKIQEHGGRLVDLAGDAVFVEFPNVVEAVNWALDLQRPTNAPVPHASGRPLFLRIGINFCDLLVDQGRLVGDGVNIASRIHQIASPGEIVVTEAVREHVEHRIDVTFRDLGERELKNISRPIRVYRLEAHGLRLPDWIETVDVDRAMHTLVAVDLSDPMRAATPSAGQALPPFGPLQEYLVHEVLPASGGRVVQRRENGLLLDFPEARRALRAAFEIQRVCSHANAGVDTERQPLPRMGVQMGEPLAEGAGPTGRSAGTATRLTGIAAPGEIVVTSAVRAELTPVLDADIEDLGECYFAELNQPVRAYRLGAPKARQLIDLVGGADDLRPTIAVIPFNEHGDGHGSIGEILAEEVIAALSCSAEMNVVSRLSTTAFRGRTATLDEVGVHLKANYVLSGAYRVSSGALILAAELSDAKTRRVVWAKDLKGSVAGIVEGKDELIDRIVAATSAAVMTRELERSRSQSLHSLETFTLLIGAIALMHRLSSHDFARARDMLQIVAQRVPRHAIPHAWLAKWHVLRVWQSWSDDPAKDTRFALDCSKRALDNDSQCSLALAIDGFVQTNLLKALDVAQERYELALSVNPSDSLAWSLRGMLHAFKGEGAQAVKGTQRALRLSPLDPHRYFYDSLAGGAELAAGHYERAIELTQRSLRANRMHASTFRMLAISQWQLGRHDAARKTVAELMKVEPGLTVRKWFERSPSSDYAIGRLCADALRNAGVPN
jgi:class 3 adenylate cyclase/TolB-like protein